MQLLAGGCFECERLFDLLQRLLRMSGSVTQCWLQEALDEQVLVEAWAQEGLIARDLSCEALCATGCQPLSPTGDAALPTNGTHAGGIWSDSFVAQPHFQAAEQGRWETG